MHTIHLLLLWGAAIFMPLQLGAQSPPGDCAGAYLLCDARATVRIEHLPDAGPNAREIPATACGDWVFPETNVAWFKWEVAEAGTLAFTLLPLRTADDLDFVLYRLNGALDECGRRTELRSMCAGAAPAGAERAAELPCTGATGLATQATDRTETIGCQPGSDNFLAPIAVLPGERYALFVNNFRSSDGFLLSFTGDVAFRNLGDGCHAPVSGTTLAQDDRWRFSPAYPNPAVGRVRVDVTATEAAEGQLQLIDAKGALLRTQPAAVQAGINHLELGLDHYPAGLYFLRIELGSAVYLTRFDKK